MLTVISTFALLGMITSHSVEATSTETAIFSGGCFWSESAVFQKLPGVISVVSGYTGGHTKNPSYEDVTGEKTGHKEAVQIVFDPTKITYNQLLETYWHNIDPFDANGQFCDQGDSYRAFIFYTNEAQKKEAEASKTKLEAHFKKSIATEIEAASTFYPAEDYHQNYTTKNPINYKLYKISCGRDERLKEIWG